MPVIYQKQTGNHLRVFDKTKVRVKVFQEKSYNDALLKFTREVSKVYMCLPC